MVIAAIEALPRKALIRERYADGNGDVCAIGALIGNIALIDSVAGDMAIEQVARRYPGVAARLASFDLAVAEAQALQELNDRRDGSEEDRYEYVLQQLRSGRKLESEP
jgi:hypothetical protein